MHIPDGYLGPYTYIAMFLIMIPIWLYAGHKLNRELKSKQVPLLALSAAFSFVIMMFNVPVLGGSTGHAVGGAIVGIVLGPWAAVVSISVALIIQALVFGDGGVTAIGANCFNMAFLMPFVAYYVYKFISMKSEVTSFRRIVAAALAGYISLTVAAGATGLEFGLQPILHPAVDGMYMYMPYGLEVTLPAMLGEHMIFFSFLEALVTALVLAYLQKADPSMLEARKPKSKKAKGDMKPATA